MLLVPKSLVFNLQLQESDTELSSGYGAALGSRAEPRQVAFATATPERCRRDAGKTMFPMYVPAQGAPPAQTA